MSWFMDSWPTLILLGAGLHMANRLTYGVRGPEPGDPIYVSVRTGGWVLIALGLLPILVASAVTFVGGLLGLLAATTLVEVVVQRRAAQRRSMSMMLALLAERGQQLDSSILLTGRTHRGIVARAAERLLTALRRGAPLDEAIAAYPRALPPEAIAYVAAGRSMKVEAAALRELSRSDQSELAALWRACVDRLSYLIFVLMVMVIILTFVMIKILPEFSKIFSEFDLALPAMTLGAIEFAQFFGDYLAAPIGGFLVLSLLCGIAVGIAYLSDVPVLRPWSDWLFRSRRSTHVLRILAVATEQRQPLPEVLHRIAYVYPSAPIRSRLAPAATAVNAGADWRDALRKARIVSRAEHSLLTAAEKAGNLPWALREIAKRREKRAVYHLATALQVLYPVIIVLLGAFIAFYVVSLFMPLVQLIEGMSY